MLAVILIMAPSDAPAQQMPPSPTQPFVLVSCMVVICECCVADCANGAVIATAIANAVKTTAYLKTEGKRTG
jgi:hypothetical protein